VIDTGWDGDMGLFGEVRTVVERRPDGAVILRSAIPLPEQAQSMAHAFRATAAAAPDRMLAAQRDGDGWRELTYAEARAEADAAAQWLLDHRRGDDPLMIVSGNSIEHLVLTLAAFTAGIPVVPVSTAYSLLSADHQKLAAMARLVRPAFVFADAGTQFAGALKVVAAESEALTLTADGSGDVDVAELATTAPTEDVDRALAGVGPDTLAKILFTSGSTGHPKGVRNTHRMLTANMAMVRAAWPFLADEPPVLLDWLPWSHTFGGNHNVDLVLTYGGSLYIDDGRPTPELFDKTLRNLRDVRPTLSFDVPAAYALLLPALRADPELARQFLSRLRFVFFAASALPQHLWDGFEKLSGELGRPVPMTTSWGATETAPAATSANYPTGRSDCIGVPLPGVEIKLAPIGDKTEIRVRGPNVTPGYHNRPDLSAAAFDEDGFYRTGDAVRLIDPTDPGRGLQFDGRIAEDFKLLTGTWVRVGALRSRLLEHAQGLVRDAVLAGQDRSYVGALVWLAPAEARRLCGTDDAADPRVRDALRAALQRVNAVADGSSQCICRAVVLSEPASLDAGEITDKGYVNQRATLDRRAAAVELLYADPPAPEVCCAD
jgi:feruloyl-CoA synthase